MQTLNIAFTDKEMQVIELMAPGKTAEEIINIVLKDWFSANADRMYKQVKPQEQVLDELIAAHAEKIAAEKLSVSSETVKPAPAG